MSAVGRLLPFRWGAALGGKPPPATKLFVRPLVGRVMPRPQEVHLSQPHSRRKVLLSLEELLVRFVLLFGTISLVVAPATAAVRCRDAHGKFISCAFQAQSLP
jgi:hypothetical protein